MSLTIYREEEGKRIYEFSKDGEDDFHKWIANTMIEKAIYKVAIFHNISAREALSMYRGFMEGDEEDDFYKYSEGLDVWGSDDD